MEAMHGLKTFCLHVVDGKPALKRKHSYFYQVQTQLYVSSATAYYFMVWTSKELFYKCIELDSTFMQQAVSKLKPFYFNHLLPALTTEL